MQQRRLARGAEAAVHPRQGVSASPGRFGESGEFGDESAEELPAAPVGVSCKASSCRQSRHRQPWKRARSCVCKPALSVTAAQGQGPGPAAPQAKLRPQRGQASGKGAGEGAGEDASEGAGEGEGQGAAVAVTA